MPATENSIIRLTFNENPPIETKRGSTLLEILNKTCSDPQAVYLAKVDNNILSLQTSIQHDCHIQWLDINHAEVRRSNQQTICLLLIQALHELDPEAILQIQHSLGDGIYCEIKNASVTPQLLKDLNTQLKNHIQMDNLIQPVQMEFVDAIKRLKNQDPDFWYQENISPHHPVTLYQYMDVTLHLGYPLFASAGKVSDFKLELWPPGFILNIIPFTPKSYDSHPLKPKKIFQVFQEYREWEQILGIKEGHDLNLAIQKDEIYDLVKITEALHEKKIARIADQINQEREHLRLIFAAGPSSSGKTTFIKRLNIQLRVNGLSPLLISLDDYFIDKDKTPRDENGKPNFESIHALNIDRFNHDLDLLMKGKEVVLPRYDFLKGKSVETNRVRVPNSQPIVIEGLHGLNESLSETIPFKNKMKIFISALTQLNITNHLRIPTSDIRLMRRLIRDYQFRGYSAEHTLQMWPDVREGEERNIFPFQEEADIIFNSALVYEISVLLYLVRPLLQRISTRHHIYPDAQRLLELYFCFLKLNPDVVPRNSILREFIGGSSFSY